MQPQPTILQQSWLKKNVLEKIKILERLGIYTQKNDTGHAPPFFCLIQVSVKKQREDWNGRSMKILEGIMNELLSQDIGMDKDSFGYDSNSRGSECKNRFHQVKTTVQQIIWTTNKR